MEFVTPVIQVSDNKFKEYLNMINTLRLDVFNGKPCRKCGNTLRYFISKRCVDCKKQHNHNNYQKSVIMKRHDLENE